MGEQICGLAVPYDLEGIEMFPETFKEQVKVGIERYTGKKWDELKHGHMLAIKAVLIKEEGYEEKISTIKREFY